MKPGEPILLICHFFPPVFDIGGRRWAKFAKELARRGHPVHVIRTTKRPNERDSLWAKDAEHPNIHHHPIPNRYPAVMTRWPLTSLWDKLAYRFWLKVLPLFTKGNYYDVGMLSRKDLLRTATALVKEHGIRNVIATGAPFSQLTFATELKAIFPDLHLTIDFRDEWTWVGHYGLASLSPARLYREKRMEEFAVISSWKIISPHMPVIEHLKRTYSASHSRYLVLPNVVDPDDFSLATKPIPDGHFRMIYAGSLYGNEHAGAYFEQVMSAFDLLREKAPDCYTKCTFDLYITGQGTEAYRDMVAARGMTEQVRFHTPLPVGQIMKRTRASDLIVAYMPADKVDVFATKFNEALYMNVPILHVGPPGLVSHTIISRRMGDSVRLEELAQELPRIITGERKIDLDPNPDLSDVLLGPVTDKLLREVLA